ncbi:DUF4013 domain-containing protein [Halostagnicola larsenii]|nr:DUF4013 domain-containing protein [Halostagnicola larsenii]
MIIGAVLGFFGWLFLPLFVLMGYFVRTLEKTVHGEDEPPEFTGWGDLLIKGVVASVISLVYSIVPVVGYLFVVFVFLGAGGAIGGDGGGVLAGIGIMSMIFLLPLIFLIYYIVPAALTNYAQSGEFKDAFNFSDIKPVVLSVDYLVAVLAPLFVAMVSWVIMAILVVTLVGILLIPFVQFYFQVSVFRMFGTAFKNQQKSITTETTSDATVV